MKYWIIFLFLGLVYAQLSIDNVQFSKDSYKAGDAGYLTITVSNLGQQALSGVTLFVEYPPGIEGSSEQAIGVLESGGTTNAAFNFRIYDVNNGIYSIRIRAEGILEKQQGLERFVRRSFIPIKIVEEPEFIIKLDKNILENKGAVKVTVENKGGIAKNVYLRTEPISIANQDKIFLGEIEEKKEVEIKFEASSEGTYETTFYLDYENEIGDKKTYSSKILLTIKPSASQLKIKQIGELIAKKTSTLVLEISGTQMEEVELNIPNMTIEGGNNIYVGEINGKKTISLNVINPDLVPGTNIIPITVDWREEGIQKTEIIEIPLTVTVEAEIGIYLEADPTPLQKNKEHTISVLVSNLGSYSIEGVQVSLDSNGIKLLEISKSKHIGELQKDDFSTVQFEVMPEEVGEQEIIVTVRYKDGTGKWSERTYKQKVNVESEEDEKINLVHVLGGILIGAITTYLVKRK